MIPSALVGQLEEGTGEFLRTSFWSGTPGFESVVSRWLARRGALFQGPFVNVRLPFVTADGSGPGFEALPMAFAPYAHQRRAFDRLSAQPPRHTIVATGTGSGKTESFLHPILAHCARHKGERGVKAVLIYPMNALASDQALRLARMIHGAAALEGVRAGLYVGGEPGAQQQAVMGPEALITHRDTLRENPPDILLTNYKMLDYLLLRPEDQLLWRFNDPQTLRYIVVDELHTFDGAQGTDLACLLRRLRARLGAAPGSVCCVGTSATLGGGDGLESLRGYAQAIFGVDFEASAIVGEERQQAQDFLGDVAVVYEGAPGRADAGVMEPAGYGDVAAYLGAQLELWFGAKARGWDRVALGQALKGHAFLRAVLRALGGKVRRVDEVAAAIGRRDSAWGVGEDGRLGRLRVLSFLALVSHARRPVARLDGKEAVIAPFLQVQVQLWMRELRRVVATVGQEPELRFYDDLTAQTRPAHLPVAHCRECGAMAWATLVDRDRPHDLRVGDLKRFYSRYFAFDARLHFIYPEGTPLAGPALRRALDPKSLRCESLGPDEAVPAGKLAVSLVQLSAKGGGPLRCPCCEARGSVALVGFRAATLTSTFVSQLFASRYNDDKKLLTFSDSVQDAAHRAGFFGARTWRFNLRVALARFLLATPDSPSLADLDGRFVEWWLGRASGRAGTDPRGFVATFIAPNMLWLAEYERLIERDSTANVRGSVLFEQVQKRLSWAFYEEFCLNAVIGRSLTRSGLAVAHVDRALLEPAVAALTERLKNEVGGLRDLAPLEVSRWALGVLERLRQRGGVIHRELPEDYITKRNTWAFHSRHHMPSYGPRSRLPALLTSASGARRFISLDASWHQRWFERVFGRGRALISAGAWLDAMKWLTEALVNAGVLAQREARGHKVWGLRPEALRVSTDVVALDTPRRAGALMVWRGHQEIWDNAPSLDGQTYTVGQDQDRGTYYRDLYRHGDVQRVVAREHTGLLGRTEREQLETDFKANTRHPWLPNLLSCTPTLEMGIDIGDLSTAVLCSVPPGQANYLQRIGRAGRRDGNALLLTIATAHRHDLYFFTQPEQMLAGAVPSPGVYLNAAAVLERQLVAYALDCWVNSGIKRSQFPRKLSVAVRSQKNPAESERQGAFPYNLLEWMAQREDELLDGFVGLFGQQLSRETLETLGRFLRGREDEAGLRWRLLGALREQATHRAQLSKQRAALRKRIRELNALAVLDLPGKEELAELERELEARIGMIEALDGREVLGWLTDEGLLPNYAFPEEGVTLKSVVYRRKGDREDSGGKRYQTWHYTYARAAANALTELAPRNAFHATGRRVTIDQVDMSLSKVEHWRFCPSCSHAQLVDMAKEQALGDCPACGDPRWSSRAQRRKLLRLRQVYANTSDRKSRIQDDSEERQPRFYQRQFLIHCEQRHVTRAWVVAGKAYPFGFEHLRKATFREINFGELSDRGESLEIAGENMSRTGFEICGHCGKVQEGGDKEPVHDFTCPGRKDPSKVEIERCLYLYRTFESEAVRLLLPFVGEASEDRDDASFRRKRHSFIAALNLGLKRRFKGQVAHLRAELHDEPIEDSDQRKQFLVIYDTVPGGTGYLKELVAPGELMRVLREALDAMLGCPCQHEEDKDGCYRCLFAYRNSRGMDHTSRKTAIELLTRILRFEGKMEPSQTLSDLSVNPLLESALEELFVQSLGALAVGGQEAEVSLDVVHGKQGYRLRVPTGRKDDPWQVWEVEPQVELGPDQGVSLSTRPDFVFWPVRGTQDCRPVAVYLDGWSYHRQRIDKDMRQRMALVSSGKFWTWSLTWADVVSHLRGQPQVPPSPVTRKYGRQLSAMLAQVGQRLKRPDLRTWPQLGSLDQLALFLSFKPSQRERLWSSVGQALAAVPIGAQKLTGPKLADWRQKLEAVAEDGVVEFLAGAVHVMVGGMLEDGPLRLFAGAQRGGKPEDLATLCWLDDGELAQGRKDAVSTWNAYLRLWNQLQCLPWVVFVTASSLEVGGTVEALRSVQGLPAPDGVDDDDEASKQALAEVLTEVDEEHREMIQALWARGCGAPSHIGYELMSSGGRGILGEALLVWEGVQVALVYDGEENVAPFEKAGWRAMDLDEAASEAESFERLAQWFGGKG